MKGQDVQEERTALSFFLMTAVYVWPNTVGTSTPSLPDDGNRASFLINVVTFVCIFETPNDVQRPKAEF
jgi:hypothetical protein